jgi:acetoacetyl-CoA synthetase
MNSTNTTSGASTSAKLLWRHAKPKSTPMYKYLQQVNQIYCLELSTYPELHQWSIEHIDEFWQSVWSFAGIKAEGSPCPVSELDCPVKDTESDHSRPSTLTRPCFLAQNSSRMPV